MSYNKNSTSIRAATSNEKAAWSSNAGLAVTVISTTVNGTVAALKAATRLAAGLNAVVTLLNFEIVPSSRPLHGSASSIKQAMNQQRWVLRESAVNTADVNLKIRVCRDWSDGVQRLLRRRSLIVVGGARRWWVSRAEKLEKVLVGLGHHVIFIDTAQKPNWMSRRNNCAFSFGKNSGRLQGHKPGN